MSCAGLLDFTKSYAGYVGPDCNEKEVVGFSPAASKVAFLSNEGSVNADNFTLYTVNSNGTGNLSKIVQVTSRSSPVILSQDGKMIVFSASVNGTNQLFTSNMLGMNTRQLTSGNDSVSAIAIFPNSTKIIFGTNLSYENGFANIYSINSDGTHLFQITHDPQDKFWAAVSANGKIIAYSIETGVHTDKIFAVNTDGTNLHFVTDGSLFSYEKPVISDNGSQITFSRFNGVEDFVYRINEDGSALVSIGPLGSSPRDDFIMTHEGNRINYWPIFRPLDSSKVIIAERINGTMQLFASDDNGVHMIPLVDNSYFKPNPNCKIPYSSLQVHMKNVTNSSLPYETSEFPFAVPVLLISIISIIAFYRIRK
ncbi:MAG: DPP IV N-terminal domain-containing protein [Thaumarchaeota archaeon]|nr:DPP IV N-terminal domain-containing protein [Nitrososphaerota archaeon]